MGSRLAGAPHLLLSVLPPDRLQDSLPSEEMTTNMRRMGGLLPSPESQRFFLQTGVFSLGQARWEEEWVPGT